MFLHARDAPPEHHRHLHIELGIALGVAHEGFGREQEHVGIGQGLRAALSRALAEEGAGGEHVARDGKKERDVSYERSVTKNAKPAVDHDRDRRPVEWHDRPTRDSLDAPVGGQPVDVIRTQSLHG